MTDCIIELNIEEKKWNDDIPDIDVALNKVKNAVFEYLYNQEKLPFLQLNKPLLINICLSNDAHVHALNKEFRHIDKSTNVLSFANIDFAEYNFYNNQYSEIELGDIIIAYETMQQEATEQQISLYNHFCHLLIHGILHLCGYDHIEPEEAEHMENIEIKILHSLQIANPYE